MTAEFYLQTIEHVFQKHTLPNGQFVHRGKPIDPDAIQDTALLAIEGERDDISGSARPRPRSTLSTPARKRKKYYPRAEVGHYGIFNGSKWRNTTAPVVEEWIRANARTLIERSGRQRGAPAEQALGELSARRAAAQRSAPAAQATLPWRRRQGCS